MQVKEEIMNEDLENEQYYKYEKSLLFHMDFPTDHRFKKTLKHTIQLLVENMFDTLEYRNENLLTPFEIKTVNSTAIGCGKVRIRFGRKDVKIPKNL